MTDDSGKKAETLEKKVAQHHRFCSASKPPPDGFPV
jgi:hypothetical protein